MGKKKKNKKLKKQRIKILNANDYKTLGKVKSKCCKKCPCFDLIKKVA